MVEKKNNNKIKFKKSENNYALSSLCQPVCERFTHARLLGASGAWIQGPLTLSGLRGALCPQPLVV